MGSNMQKSPAEVLKPHIHMSDRRAALISMRLAASEFEIS